MSRRRLPAAGLGGMFSLAARVPIFSGYYTTPAVEGKGRADCASAARGPPLRKPRGKGLSGDFRLGVFLGDAAGEKALSWCAFMGFWDCGSEEGVFFVRCRPGTALSPLRARTGAALVFFLADAHEGKGRAFLKKGAPKTFTLAALGLFTASAAPRRFPPLPARRPRRAGSSYTGWGFAASPPHTAGPAAAAGPSSGSWPGRPGYSWWPWGR